LSKSGQVKLGDFGVARLMEEANDASASAVTAGTPRYMAPERARGLPTTAASDVYSVGVVMYEMLAGAPPFTGSSPIAVALSHLNDPPPPLPAGTPRRLERVVMRALPKAPEERYRDAGEMAAALARARESIEPDVEPRTIRVSRGNGLAEAVAPVRSRAPDQPDPTLLAPVVSPRRIFNPDARRRTLASFALVLGVLVAMAIGSILLASPGRVRVPQLRGLTRVAIIARTRHVGLHPSFTSRYDSAQPGTAIGQSPISGTRIDDGSTVRVVLSAGPPPVKVPQLVGQGSGSATSILSSLGLGAQVTAVAAPGTQPGTVTAQAPSSGTYVRSHGKVALSVAETPQWRPVTSFSGTDGGQSVPFRIRGSQWRVVYHMQFNGMCSLIFFCDGPSAQVLRISDGSTPASFGLNQGDNQTRVVKSGPGLYQIKIQPGNDTASWSIEVDDYY
jgi:serine/threonine-protein kinase